MSTKLKNVFVCSECGAESPKWLGKCPSCSEWNTLVEEIRGQETDTGKKNGTGAVKVFTPVTINDICEADEIRYDTQVNELNRVLGGGIVKGSLVLLGGDPGIGKSTLLLQICGHLGKTLKILYVSGEESQRQIKLRAARLNVSTPNLFLLAETDIESIINTIIIEKPDLVMIDSIQTMTHSAVSSAAGSVSQVKECTQALMRCAKGEEISIFVVGHVNKDGAIAGPKVLEHIVDAVLYFEGERNLPYRILRAVKNRYGSTNEIGVFEMSSEGLCEVENPSMMLLSGRPVDVSGTCVACIMEGSRPILAEVQALVTKTGFGTPRRMSTGFDYNRMSLILAVLEKRAGFLFSSLDTYVNIIGGLKLDEPAADLSVALALVSGLTDIPIRDDVFVFGELGLAGEIRSVSNAELRVNEAARLGFKKCIIPKASLTKLVNPQKFGIEIIGVSSISQAIAALKK
ncbi:DNA repair protein RadA [Acetanaerobacterium elongatum]|uniref:DNA repair protein RadA n=1 Tax=Acetanaerobacterium elongatum TaxID=258515 RepID=A0A1H0BDU9_9FIRM|nr:DNA repair protein RadA [Acetanaerobacterium elongatum]SDN43852.1 DNA repair protein RadA/Sms [Acetanaerobacterium elongatum]